MRMAKILAVALMLTFLLSVMPIDTAQGDSDPETDVYGGDFLLDRGNGDTLWIAISAKSDYKTTIIESLTAAGIDASVSGNEFTIEGKSTYTIGAPGSVTGYKTSGTTGVTTTCTWSIFRWAESEWEKVTDINSSYSGGPIAVAFYPEGIVPAETPLHKAAWTVTGADSENSMNQIARLTNDKDYQPWYAEGDEYAFGSYAATLSARDHVIVKYGSKQKDSNVCSVVSYNARNGAVDWSFQFKTFNFIDMSGMAMVGQYLYIPTTAGYVYKFNWMEGPGEDNCNVTTFKNTPYSSHTAAIPNSTGADLIGKPSYGSGPCTLTYDSGSIFFKHYNGMVYCFDLNLNLQWARQMMGGAYIVSVTVQDDYVAAGAYDGCLYVMDKHNGTIIDSELVFLRDDPTGLHGSVNVPIFINVGDGKYKILTSYNDGLIMDATSSGIAIFDFDGSQLTNKIDVQCSSNDLSFESVTGQVSGSMTRLVNDSFQGIICTAEKGHFMVDTSGNITQLDSVMVGNYVSHTPPTLVNGTYLYASTYPNTNLFRIKLDGTVEAKQQMDLTDYSMAVVSVVDGMIFVPNDLGFNTIYGKMGEYVPPDEIKDPTPLWVYAAYTAGGVAAAGGAFWLIGFFVLGWKHPYAEVKHRIYVFFYGENYTHNTKSKRKVRTITILGIIATLIACIMSLCLGSKTTLNPIEALSALSSALSKKGAGLTQVEYLVYIDRAPRMMAALGAGIGLSVAGAIYQAVIKNPLVEPYIMGVSSGAGTVVVAVLTFNFTFFGLISPNDPYMVAFSAIIGGLLAFGCTMFLAMKTGGKPINYVLAGVVIGLVFSAVQSLMIIKAGNKITNALSWLYGSFTGITWEQAWIVLIPSLVLAFIPLFWAKEMNLVLLGEDQAQQMGLNAKRFDQFMLILASIITAFCVAFCGVIGFVGLVIPHLSRMILGGDHRMMLPATMVLGGLFMVLADLFARILVTGFELPVGAITSVIGVPVFAYLLIKRGRSYDV